jgi:transposase
MQEANLTDGSDHSSPSSHDEALPPVGAARMRYAERSQMMMQYCSLDELLPPDHPARVIWQAVQELDLSRFEQSIQSRELGAGRPANDVRVMVGLWLWAAVDAVGGGRELAELCENHLAYRWMCGGLSMNYHTLNDFRTGHEKALDELFTQVLGRLMHGGLVSLRRISQDGMRVRASAGRGSFKRQEKLEECLKQAQDHLRELKVQQEPAENSKRSHRQAAEEFAAQDRLDRVRRAMEALQQVQAVKATLPNKQRRQASARASITDPDARNMKMANGGFNPAYNVQLAGDPQSRAIVGVQVCQNGGDAPLSEPMRQQVEARAAASGHPEQKVEEHLLDGGYVNLDVIDRAQERNVALFMPVPQPNKEGIDRFAPRANDSPAVAQWRTRMASEAAQAIYQQRASTSETINADLRTYRGLGRFLVRGLKKVQCVALWSALAYNLMHFAGVLFKT